MKLLFFDDFVPGVLKGDRVVDIRSVVSDVPHLGPHDLISNLIERFDAFRARIEAHVASEPGVPLAQVRIRPPLPRPINIICMAVNYMESGTRAQAAPINAFIKPPGCIIGQGDSMLLPDVPATVFEGEAELAVVVGKRAHHVRAADAYDHVFGYVNMIDGSARGLQPFYQMKAHATFAPIGPYLVTADELPAPQQTAIKLWVNGELTQSFDTSDMAHDIAHCIEWVTSFHPLEPGDILATGTNHLGLSPLQDGDRVELECEGLGRLQVSVRDPLARSWVRGTRKQQHEQGITHYATQLTGKYAK